MGAFKPSNEMYSANGEIGMLGYPDPESSACGAVVGGTLKEYEDQLTALRKDNFNLKLRIYFLEERLQPHSHDELHKKNLELKVKVGSLTRELKETKNLLRSAAEAMEFTEQTAAKKEADLNKNIMELKMELEQAQALGGQLCEDSVALYTEAFNLNKNLFMQPKLQVNDKTLESTNTSNSDENHVNAAMKQKENIELEKLKHENAKLYQVTQDCLERIKRMDKIEQKQKESLQRKEERIAMLQKELQKSGLQEVIQIQDVSLECEKIESKYKEMLVEKDVIITELENKLNMQHAQGDGRPSITMRNMNIQEMLTKRLREMAYFLDTLISHRCVIGEEKQKKFESLLEESLKLPVDLELDPEAARQLETSLIDNTMGDQSIDIFNLTRLLGHHVSLDNTNHQLFTKEYQTHSCCNKSIKAHCSAEELSYITQREKVIENKNEQMLQSVLEEKEEVVRQLEEAKNKMVRLEKAWDITRDEYEKIIVTNHKQINKLSADIEKYRDDIQIAKQSNKQITEQLQRENAKLQENNKTLLQSMMLEIQNETKKWEKKMEEQRKDMETRREDIDNEKEKLLKQCEELERKKDYIELQLAEIEQQRKNILKREEELRRLEAARDLREEMEDQVVAIDGEVACPSPDQGIDSDRHSSLELPESYSSQDEVLALRTQLVETEQKLEAALRKLTPLQLRHHKVERAICKQIHKTTAVLREAKKNFNT